MVVNKPDFIIIVEMQRILVQHVVPKKKNHVLQQPSSIFYI